MSDIQAGGEQPSVGALDIRRTSTDELKAAIAAAVRSQFVSFQHVYMTVRTDEDGNAAISAHAVGAYLHQLPDGTFEERTVHVAEDLPKSPDLEALLATLLTPAVERLADRARSDAAVHHVLSRNVRTPRTDADPEEASDE